MSHFAKVLNGKVINVIVAEPEFFLPREQGGSGFVDSGPGRWIQTSYNTHHGVHQLGGTPLRLNFAGVGMWYYKNLDGFVYPQPYPSWKLNESIGDWEPPVPRPTDGPYDWNEETGEWVYNAAAAEYWNAGKVE